MSFSHANFSHAKKLNKLNKRNGSHHRRAGNSKVIKVKGGAVYKWLKRNNFKRFHKEFTQHKVHTINDLYKVRNSDLVSIGVAFRLRPRMIKELNKLRCDSGQYAKACEEEIRVKKAK